MNLFLPSRATNEPPPLTILVVEDHPTIARQIVAFLDGLKWQTDHAATGALAIELATREIYDVILLDLNLPDLDGLDVCRAIKERAPRNVPVLMLTARDAFEDKARGFNGGADDYLTKPFDLRELALRCEALARRCAQAMGWEIDFHAGAAEYRVDVVPRRAH